MNLLVPRTAVDEGGDRLAGSVPAGMPGAVLDVV